MGDQSIRDGSVVAHLYSTVSDWARDSRIAQSLDALSGRLSVAATESRITSTAATVGDWIRASWCYRWLTAEPDPDVIVIDLRETYTVAPIIRVLDRVVDPLADAWDGSAVEATLSGIADAPVRALGIVAVVAVLIETALSLALGDLTQSGLLVRAVVFGFAALAIQVPLSASELTETRTGRHLRAVLEPPEPRDDDGDHRNSDDGDRD
ncbi:hypothetical protein SAMN05216388_101436 [Halorientalis persicus]|uniref:Uncharacterized protein n=1 Tax=Halorientalis persicus TaxID=1367881 RepID=A0A1H8QLG9_9EURY|nr:hypothetical protein [Halorientalis persicus]SEO54858.1 hypothetical protein SAMN05216388_101436 [Halorientalis persicus]